MSCTANLILRLSLSPCKREGASNPYHIIAMAQQCSHGHFMWSSPCGLGCIGWHLCITHLDISLSTIIPRSTTGAWLKTHAEHDWAHNAMRIALQGSAVSCAQDHGCSSIARAAIRCSCCLKAAVRASLMHMQASLEQVIYASEFACALLRCPRDADRELHLGFSILCPLSGPWSYRTGQGHMWPDANLMSAQSMNHPARA